MRLIDANKLKVLIAIENDGQMNTGKLVTELFNGIESVEAIPIWWIDSYCTDCSIDLRDNNYKAIKKLLEDWREENGK